MRNVLLLLLFVSEVLSSSCHSQQILKHFTVDNGLPSSEIYFVHQSHDGYIWFCTDRGVSRYNGYKFENFTTHDGLSYNTVFKIFEDQSNNLWFTGFDGSLSIWDFELKTFRSFEKNDDLQKKLGEPNWIQNIAFSDKTIRFHCYNRLISNKYVIDYQKTTKQLSEPKYEFIQEDNQDSSRIHNSVQLIYPIEKKLDCIKRSITVYVKKISETKIKSWHEYREIINEVINKHYKVSCEYSDVLENITFYKDLLFISGRNGFDIYRNKERIARLFPNVTISGMEIDFEENIWITTANGVYVLGLSEIEAFDLSPIFENGENITAIEVLNKKIFVGTSQGRIYNVQDAARLQESKLAKRIHFFSKQNNQTLTVWDDKQRTMIDRDGNLHNSKNNVGTIPYLITQIDSENSFIMSSARSYNTRNGKPQTRIRKRILHTCMGKENEFFFSTYKDVYKVVNSDFEHPIRMTEEYELDKKTVRRIYYDEAGFLIFATTGGGITLVYNGKLTSEITSKEGLPSNEVNACYLDHQNRKIWSATNRGLCVMSYSFDNKKFKIESSFIFNKSSGIPSDYVQEIASDDKSVFFTFRKSIISFRRTFNIPKVTAPKLNFSSFLNNGTDYLNNIPQFNYDQNEIRIEYIANTFYKSHHAKHYRYRLIHNGMKKAKWNYSNERTALFTNLEAGKYTFEISAKSLNSNWSSPEQLHFAISPHFLNRWSVRLIILGLILITFFWLARKRIKKIEAENTKELRLKNLQLTNQRLELSSLRGQMNPHFIFNVLGSIQKNILLGEEWQANHLLTRFSKLIRSSLEYSRIDYITIEKEIEFLKNYLEIEQQRTPGKFDFTIEAEVNNDFRESLIPALLIQPLCENAIKHAFVSEKGILSVDIARESDSLVKVSIKDNGVGYLNSKKSNTTLNHSMGMEIVKSRLQLYNDQGIEAQFLIEPLDAHTTLGTVITLYLPWK